MTNEILPTNDSLGICALEIKGPQSEHAIFFNYYFIFIFIFFYLFIYFFFFGGGGAGDAQGRGCNILAFMPLFKINQEPADWDLNCFIITCMYNNFLKTICRAFISRQADQNPYFGFLIMYNQN